MQSQIKTVMVKNSTSVPNKCNLTFYLNIMISNIISGILKETTGIYGELSYATQFISR